MNNKKKNSFGSVNYVKEPKLLFNHGQETEYPKDGLLLFGPVDSGSNPKSMRIGVIGTGEGVSRYKKWVCKITEPIKRHKEHPNHTIFPGYEAIYQCRWPKDPIATIVLDRSEIIRNIMIEDRYQAIYYTVGMYEEAINKYIREEDQVVDMWFVVIPEEVYTFGRPEKKVSVSDSTRRKLPITFSKAKELMSWPSFFEEENQNVELYRYEKHFHNQLKARLLSERVVIQVVRETTLVPEDFQDKIGRSIRKLQDPANVAWNLCTTAFFKSGGQPWRLSGIRRAVCYIGLVYKRVPQIDSLKNACCGAQMFLDSGDGTVFRGAVGPWYSETDRTFHLNSEAAYDLISMVLQAYKDKHGVEPEELFIHGKTDLNDEEWEGIKKATPAGCEVNCVKIRSRNDIKLYRPGSKVVQRGIYMKYTRRRGYLWTRGYIPRLDTYPGREIPTPLYIDLQRGEADIDTVVKDIMGLTKLNYNACIYGDGLPVTLRFANAVGEILTAAPLNIEVPPLPFRHYI